MILSSLDQMLDVVANYPTGPRTDVIRESGESDRRSDEADTGMPRDDMATVLANSARLSLLAIA
jgi:hypothetical protein